MFVTNLLLLEKKHHFFSVLSQSYQRLSEFSDSFFPQMKPEKFGEKKIDLNDNEKLVFDILQKEGSMLIDELKEKAGLSNKQWDKSVKGLRKHEVVNVDKRGDEVYIQVTE